ncbi:MAG TPA: glycoside hydrolase family 3 N-terminal domain-containing protein, partial [Dehalococcoidia bacterium]|nr:glycoside hydrolase family 3 N-terminal domain-containing protein [Dehalococcoidia bacterium]
MLKLALILLILTLLMLSGDKAAARPHYQASDGFVDQVLSSLTPRERIQQLFILGFRGPEVTPELQELIAGNKVGGIYLSQENCNIINGAVYDPSHCRFSGNESPDTPGQVAKLTGGLQAATCESTRRSVGGAPVCLPLLVAIDHEGDGWPLTRLLNGFTPIPSQMAIGATFNPEQAETAACIVAKELRSVGVNMLFGPDLDVLDRPRSGGQGDQGIRVFGGDSRWIAEMGTRYVEGIHRCAEGRLATVAKHFPGHGRSNRSVDVEDIPVVVGKTPAELADVDLRPFLAVARGEDAASVTDAIMNSHLSYTNLTGCEPNTPMPFSPSCMQSFYGFPELSVWRQAGGVTVADALDVGAVVAYAQRKYGTYLQANIVEEALLAGNDMLPLASLWQLQGLEATINYLLARYQQDPRVQQRVDDAARRIIALKQRLYPSLDPALVSQQPQPAGSLAQPESLGQVESVAARAVTFIKPASAGEFQAAIPAPGVSQRILFVECWDNITCSPPSVRYPPVWPQGKLQSLAESMFPGRVTPGNLRTISFSTLNAVLSGQSALLEQSNQATKQAIQDADYIVFGYLDRDPGRFPDSEALKNFLQRGPALFDLRSKQIVVFAYSSPYHLDAGELRNVDLFVALYGRTEPFLRASLRLLFHDPTIFQAGAGNGRLPVSYVFGDFVLHDLSEQVKADPNQKIEVKIDPSSPRLGEPFTVGLSTPLLARNSHRVPNETRVDFALQLSGEQIQSVSALTRDGLATARLSSERPGSLVLRVSSGDLVWTSQPISVGLPPLGGTGGSSFPVAPVAGGGAAAALALAALGAFGYRRQRKPAPAASAASGAVTEEPPQTRLAAELRIDAPGYKVYVRGAELQPPLSRE